MEKQKQIEEMANDIASICPDLVDSGCMGYDCVECLTRKLKKLGYRKQSEDEVLEALDKFRDLLVNKFIELCDYNDYGRINLLLIGETIDRIYDRCVDDLKGGAE